MIRKSEIKKKYDPVTGKYIKMNIHGEGMGDVLRSVGSKLMGKTAQEIAKKAAVTAATKAATKTGEHIGNMAGDKIVQLLSRKNPEKLPTIMEEPSIDDRVNRLISGGKMRKR